MATPATDPTLDARDPCGDTQATQPAATRDSEVALGRLPARYDRHEIVGRGGIGCVSRAHDRWLGRDVAVKELLPGPDPTARDRFVREVQLASQLQHPNIVPIYDVAAASEQPHYTMRLIEGTTLAERLASAPSYHARLELLPRLRDICNAVAFAHDHHIVHRDIKPLNVMLGPHGESILVDWGLAKHLDGAASSEAASRPISLSLTADGSYVGTPRYMSPEVVGGQPATERSDVWSLGIILYELLAGRAPWDATTLAEQFQSILEVPPRSPREVCPDVSPELAAICMKALARDPAQRYPDAGAMVRDLDAAITGGLVRAHAYSLGELVRRFVRRHRAVLTVATFAVVALGATATWSVMRVRSERAEAIAQRDTAQRFVKGQISVLLPILYSGRKPHPAARKWAEEALRFYRDFPASHQASIGRAVANGVLALVAFRANDAKGALALHREIDADLADAERRATTNAERGEAQLYSARNLVATAETLRMIAPEGDSFPLILRAEARARQAVASNPSAVAYEQLVKVLVEQFEALSARGADLSEIATKLEAAGTAAVAAGAGSVEASVANAVALAAQKAGDFARAERFSARALELAGTPEGPVAANELAWALLDHGRILMFVGDPDRAVATLSRGRELAEGAVKAMPDDASAANTAVALTRRLAEAELARGDTAEAVKLFTSASESYERELLARPNDSYHRTDTATTHRMLSRALARAGDAAGSKRHAARVVELLDAWSGKREDDPVFPWIELAEAQLILGASADVALEHAIARGLSFPVMVRAASVGRRDLVERLAPAASEGKPDVAVLLVQMLAAADAGAWADARGYAASLVPLVGGTRSFAAYISNLTRIPAPADSPAGWSEVAAAVERGRTRTTELAPVLERFIAGR